MCNGSPSKPIQGVLFSPKFKQRVIVSRFACQKNSYLVTVLAVVLKSDYLELFVRL